MCPDCKPTTAPALPQAPMAQVCSECGQALCFAHWITHQDMQKRYRRCYFQLARWGEVRRAAAQLGGTLLVVLLLVLFSDYGAGGATWTPW